MRLKLILIAIAGLLFSNCYQLKAQSGPTKLTPSHLSAARQLISATGMTDVRFTVMRNSSIKIFSANIEEKYREKFVAKLSEFFDKYLPLDGFREDMARIYAETFTESELNQLTAFYNSPLGKKITVVMPELTQKCMMFDQQIINSHSAELQSMIQDITKE
ncbi:MAG: DUF2059 domain-containing protein [Mucilaginibacter sp.]|uniref:DUF2059 domain-containing protein n=1 Tax=Mucilaginibacter sp. L3T2-6 TaxID=3062491 RepID=UPI002676F30B|nr:DUF2059 domain-containing protein [Mucilaginibacter sp. L3T2-6]MDO3644631.1 DUF2059 domain-containing protein [Mucilaginibacter sp. L3T2-6]MDV6216997.1 DUF2059 domain-containing protein [Mucilaginibacter sp. L3T2-6]